MNNRFETYEELKLFNDSIERQIKSLSATKNYIHYMTVPGKQMEIYGEINIEQKASDLTFGLLPCYGTDYIRKIIFQRKEENGPLTSEENFVKFIENMDYKFGRMGCLSDKVRRGLWARIIINSSRFFATSIKFESVSCFYRFKDSIYKILDAFVELRFDQITGVLDIFGRIPAAQLEELDSVLGILYKENEIMANANLECSMKWKSIYDECNRKYTRPYAPSLYSGVVPCLKAITNISNLYDASQNVSYIKFDVIKSTYFTMDGIENNLLNGHPFLMKYKKELDEFDKNEVKLAYDSINLLSKTNDFDGKIDILNNYLQQSKLVHNVNICGNVISSDEYCIFTKRQDKMYDANKYYCSVNGACEFMDSDVQFYNVPSIDRPTISENCQLFSIMDELKRETVAELGVAECIRSEKCLGFSIMANVPDDNSMSKKFLPFFFNVVGEIYTWNDLKSIQRAQRSAREEFENKKIKGFKVISPGESLFEVGTSIIKTLTEELCEKKWGEAALQFLIYIGVIQCTSKLTTVSKTQWPLILIAGIVMLIKAMYTLGSNIRLKKIIFCLKAVPHHVEWAAKSIVGNSKGEKQKRDPIMVLASMLYILGCVKEKRD